MVEAWPDPDEDEFEDGWGDDDDGEGWDDADIDDGQPSSNMFTVADSDML